MQVSTVSTLFLFLFPSSAWSANHSYPGLCHRTDFAFVDVPTGGRLRGCRTEAGGSVFTVVSYTIPSPMKTSSFPSHFNIDHFSHNAPPYRH